LSSVGRFALRTSFINGLTNLAAGTGPTDIPPFGLTFSSLRNNSTFRTDLTILSLTAYHVQLELHNPFVLSIRSATHANIIRWELLVSDGGEQRTFFGECVPVQYVTGETVESTLVVAHDIAQRINGRQVFDMHAIVAELRSALPQAPAAIAGVEIALFNAFAELTGVSVHKHLGGHGATLETDLTIAKVPNALEIARAAWEHGIRAIKIKVGGAGYDEDLARVRELVSNLPGLRLRLDPNQGFDAHTALRFIDDALKLGAQIEFVEQPTPREDYAALDEVSRLSPVPIIADEACVTPQDAFRLLSTTAVHGVNVKLMKSGLAGAQEIIAIAKAAGRTLMIGCMLESEIGLAASVALASGTGEFEYVDLDGHLLVKYDAPPTSFEARGPYLRAIEHAS
jgi:L-Ala-D/L-Glu epimerase